MRVSVMPFDDGMFDEHGARLRCLQQAVDGHGIDAMNEPAFLSVINTLHGRTFEEVLRRGWSTHERIQQDPTLLELIALDAHARYAAWLRDGASAHPQMRELINLLSSSGQRVIVRADSRRRDVTPFLERWGLYDLFACVRCADDPPIADSVYRSSYCRSWEAIIERVTRWGVDRSEVNVLDGDDDAKRIALRLLSGEPVSEVGY